MECKNNLKVNATIHNLNDFDSGGIKLYFEKKKKWLNKTIVQLIKSIYFMVDRLPLVIFNSIELHVWLKSFALF